MPPDDSNVAYFETPTRTERLQLLLYLVRNAEDIIYLRAPAGAGKTRFVRRLLDVLDQDQDQDIARVWLSARVDRDMVSAVARQLGMADDELLQWPEGAIAERDGQGLLLAVDDADQLDAAAVAQLAALHARGGHLLLVGRGGLARTQTVGDVQFVDLPGFEPGETLAFLRQQAGAQAARVDEDLAAALHRASRGLPGPLLEALGELLGREDKRPASGDAAPPQRAPVWPWLAGGSIVVLLLAVLIFQDEINGLLEPDRAQSPDLADNTATAVMIERDVRVSGEASPDAGYAAPTPVPEVALPELSRLPSPAIAMSADRPAPPVAPALAADRQPPAPRDIPPAVHDDLLETAVHEALSAADAQPASAGPRPPATLQAEPAASEKPPLPDAAEGGHVEGRGAMVEAASGPATPGSTANEAAVSALNTEQRPQDAAAEVSPAPVAAAPPTRTAEALPAGAAQGPVSVSQAAIPPMPASGPAPVEERVAAAPAKPPTAPAGATAYRQGGVDWLNSREPGRYTLQLVGARDAAAVRKFIRDHRVEQPYAIFERQLDGRPWFSLVAGDYPDRNAAVAARDGLAAGLGGAGVWPRTFGSIQKSQ